MAVTNFTYLALGDSYTIGEGLPLHDSFPYQTVQLLRKAGLPFHAPEIVAKTGWTTDELQRAINHTHFLKNYDVVSLLIGVNNQYRGRPASAYAPEFEALLQQALAFAGNHAAHVMVLSIPDWGVTPFAKDRNPTLIAREIDDFNAVNKAIAIQYGVGYIDITPGTREAAHNGSLIATDQLHPSAAAYAQWATSLAGMITKLIIQ